MLHIVLIFHCEYGNHQKKINSHHHLFSSTSTMMGSLASDLVFIQCAAVRMTFILCKCDHAIFLLRILKWLFNFHVEVFKRLWYVRLSHILATLTSWTLSLASLS